MRTGCILLMAALLQGTLIAQQVEDPEARQKHAMEESHHARFANPNPPRPAGASPAAELAKIEKSGIKTHSPRTATRHTGTKAPAGLTAQNRNKPARRSFHAPAASAKPVKGVRASANPPQRPH